MNFLPIFVNIRQKPCLVVGGGKIAARKIELLVKAGAQVQVVSPQLCNETASLKEEAKIEHINREFEASDIDNKNIVIAATNDQQVNKTVSELAQAQNIPVNVVDAPDLCSFIVPSIIDRSPVQIAISTGGSSPVLARTIRTRLETCIPSAYGKLGALLESFRESVKQRFSDVDKRRKFWESVLQGPIPELVFSDQNDKAYTALQKVIDDANEHPSFEGEVYLVGSGPGDPDLLSFKALRLMQSCDVVVYDRLVSQPIMDLVRRDAERIYAGKERSNHAIPQEGINQLLADLAKQGKRVLRLKGGDPFIFGRGGEEIETLIDQDVAFQVVPGITAAQGCASYSGIPLTHRDYAQACIFVTGHLKDESINLNWKMLAHPNQTIVFYMGLQGVKVICEKLIEHGLKPSTAAALVQKGTTPDQKVVIGDLTNLAELVVSNNIKPPTLIIVGDVVNLHEKLHWFKPGQEIEADSLKKMGGDNPINM